MSFDLMTAFVRLRPKADDGFAQQAEREVSGPLENVGSKVFSIGKMAAVAATGFAVFKGADLFKDAVSGASDLNESLSKVNVVFDDLGPAVEEWASKAAFSMGMSKQAALEAAGTFGNFLQAMGSGQKPAQEMSEGLVQLASDLASFNNQNPEDVLLALRSGMAGEAEPLRRFGVNLNAARIQAEALRLGLAKAPVDMVKVEKATLTLDKVQAEATKTTKRYGESSHEAAEANNKVALAQEALDKALAGGQVVLDGAAKSQAAYSLIMKDTALAQGDFERTSDGLANKQRIVAAQWSDMKAKLGSGLLPIVQKAVGFGSDLMSAYNEGGVAGVFRKVGSSIQAAWPDIKAGFGQFAETAWTWVQEAAPKVLDALGRLIAGLGGWIQQHWPEISATFGRIASAVWGWVQKATPVVLRKIGDLLSALGDWVANTGWPWLVQHFKIWASALWEWVQEAVPPMLAKLGDLLAQLGSWIVDTALPWLGDHLGQWAVAFIQWVGDVLPDLLPKLLDMLVAIGEWILTTALPWLVEHIASWALAFVDWVATDALPNLLIALGKLGAALIGWIGEKALELPGELLSWVMSFLDWVASVILELPRKLGEIASKIWGWITDTALDIPKKALEIGKGLLQGLWDGVKAVWNGFANWWNDHVGSIGFKVPSWVPRVGGKEFSLPDMPTFHTGTSIVPGRIGQEVLAVLQAGERVVPIGGRSTAGGDGGGRNVVTIGKVELADGVSVQRFVSELEFRLRARAA